ncbi:MAG: hypothetical protein JO368_03290 [Acidimicrobiales bacterium]|nr:hypothetical protein [Acidimicrobiales bacterium]
MHPLFGQLLAARSFKRWDGALLLVVVLPDGSPGTIPAGATDVLGSRVEQPLMSVLSVAGLRRLRVLVDSLTPAPPRSRRSPKTRK